MLVCGWLLGWNLLLGEVGDFEADTEAIDLTAGGEEEREGGRGMAEGRKVK